MTRILAIESSCDETAVAITEDGKLLANVVATQIAVHEKYGGCFFPVNGVGGEDLSFIRRAKECGVEVWCDSSVKCGHIGRQVIMPSKDIIQMP